ncbi:hypothetical protein D6D27_00748 [Aureobasidium pullulans]|nr:hypothetical protein D6D27_00748 [Aureobasidium pullulans]
MRKRSGAPKKTATAKKGPSTPDDCQYLTSESSEPGTTERKDDEEKKIQQSSQSPEETPSKKLRRE